MLATLHDYFPSADAPADLDGPDDLGRDRVRTPKRGPGQYAAQVWGEGGFWVLGVFPTMLEARRAGCAFAATDPAEPDPHTPRAELPVNWVRRRSDSHTPLYKWVRRVKGDAVQSRIWIAGHGSLNLGLFTIAEHGDTREWAAAQVSKAFVREWRAGRTIGEVVEMLKKSPKQRERVPAHVQVPERLRGLKPPTDFGPTETRAEQREAEAERRRAELEKLVTLADYLPA